MFQMGILFLHMSATKDNNNLLCIWLLLRNCSSSHLGILKLIFRKLIVLIEAESFIHQWIQIYHTSLGLSQEAS